MIILKTIKNFILDNQFKMIITEETIYISNFKRINILEETHIFLSTNHKKIHLYGNNIKMKQKVNKEVLFTGTINQIEVHNE